MTRVTLDRETQSSLEKLNGNREVGDRYFVKISAPTRCVGVDENTARLELDRRETEATGRPLVEILADLRVAGSL